MSKFNYQISWNLLVWSYIEDKFWFIVDSSDSTKIEAKVYIRIVDKNGCTKQSHYLNHSNQSHSLFTTIPKKDLASLLTNDALIVRLDVNYSKFDYEIRSNSPHALPFKNYEISAFDKNTSLIASARSLVDMIDDESTNFTIQLDDGQTIKVLKAFLAKRWSYFKDLLNSNMMEVEESRMMIEGHTYETIKKMIIFIYSGLLEIDTYNQAVDLFKAAHQYEVIVLCDMCVRLMVENIAIENAINTFLLAKTFDYRPGHVDQLKQASEKCLIEGVEMSNVIKMLLFANEHDLRKLKESCLNTIVMREKGIRDLDEMPGRELLDMQIHGKIMFEIANALYRHQ